MDKLLEAFFMCWNEHRSDELSTIFAPCASYEIVNKRKIFKGLDQIEAYWRRNSKRQRNLKMFWSLLEAKRFNGVALFYATFYDIEEKDYNQIFGYVNISSVNGQQIYSLSEEYIKTTSLPSITTNPLLWRRPT